MDVNMNMIDLIRDENVFTVSARRSIDAKECVGIIKLALRKCDTQRNSTEALFFGEKEWEDNQPKTSTHYHIAFLRSMSEMEKREILLSFQYFATKAGMGDKNVIGKWGVRHSINYLLRHALPFYRKF